MAKIFVFYTPEFPTLPSFVIRVFTHKATFFGLKKLLLSFGLIRKSIFSKSRFSVQCRCRLSYNQPLRGSP